MNSVATLNHTGWLLLRLDDARRRTDALFDLIRPERLLQRPIRERHRFLFYLGHLEAFDWNLLHPHCAGLKPFLREFDQLFAFGIDPLNADHPKDTPQDWPAPEFVYSYKRTLRRLLDGALEKALNTPAHRDADTPPLEFLLLAAIEHRLMHAETLAYMLNRAAARRPRRAPLRVSSLVAPDMLSIPAGKVRLGTPRDGWRSFAWDNESDAHEVVVGDFEIGKHMVTNGEYLRFVATGGYDEAKFWSAQDWTWRVREQVAHPAFWRRVDGRWHYRTITDLVPLPLDWPVYVSHAEASAYARWARAALPTEAQWHRAAYGTHDGGERPYPWGHALPTPSHGNFNFQSWQPQPVTAHRAGESAFGVTGLLGNGWEWTSTPFAPFPGFKPFAFYRGYSADFFDQRHYVLKGGSAFTAAPLLRRSFRNWFQPHYPYVYAGFRCVRN